MADAHKRRKQPEVVRRELLNHAARIAAEAGMAAVTVDAVASAAGVTKGGFTHHFPSKQDLILALFEEIMVDTEAALAKRIRNDPHPHGAFTRAYVDIVFEPTELMENDRWSTLAVLMLSDPLIRQRWAQWYGNKIAAFGENDLNLWTVRLAVDGIWLADIAGVELPDRAELHARLIRDASAEAGPAGSRPTPSGE